MKFRTIIINLITERADELRRRMREGSSEDLTPKIRELTYIGHKIQVAAQTLDTLSRLEVQENILIEQIEVSSVDLTIAQARAKYDEMIEVRGAISRLKSELEGRRV